MNNLLKPNPKNKEVEWNKNETLISKTDKFGIIEYCNDIFCTVSGYNDEQLINKPHSIIRHPDMPKVIFKWLWDNLNINKTIVIVIKNLAESGCYYWVYANFTILKDDNGDNHFFSSRKSVSNKVIEIIEPIYQKLITIEQKNGIEASEQFLIQFLNEKSITYNEFIKKILLENN